jgi:hypothetical protein
MTILALHNMEDSLQEKEFPARSIEDAPITRTREELCNKGRDRYPLQSK